MRFGEGGGVGRAQTPQRFAHGPVRFGQAELDALLEKRRTQVGQQFGAGEVHVGDTAHEEDHQPGRRGLRVQERRQLVPHVIDVEVEERPLVPRDQHVGDPFVLRVALEIREIRRAGNPSDLGHARTRGAMDQQDDRQRNAEQHAVQETRAEHADHGRHGHGELRPAEMPDMAQRIDLDESRHGDQHHRGQHRLREVPQQTGKEHHDNEHDERGEQP